MEILRPIISSTIIDNTNYSVAQGSFEDVVMAVITADTGRDSKFLEFSSVSELLREFSLDGKPNDKTHGQAIMDVLQAMEVGARTLVMRVVPDDAYLPNGLLALHSAAKIYGLDVSNINTPDEIINGAGAAKDIVVTLTNSTPFETKTLVSLYKKADVQEIIDFYNGDMSAASLALETLGTAIDTSGETTVAANDTSDVTFSVTGADLDIADIADTQDVVVLLSDTSTYKGYVSKNPFIGGTIIGAAAPVVDTTDTVIVNKKLQIKPITIAHNALTDKDDFEAMVSASVSPVLTADLGDGDFGDVLPIFGFCSKSKSPDEYSITINPTSKYDKTYDFRVYEVSVSKKNSLGNSVLVDNGGPFVVSFNPDAIDGAGSSLFIKDVLNKYFDELDFYFNEDNYAAFLTALGTDIDTVLGTNTLDPSLIDPLYNTLYEGSAIDNLYQVLNFKTNIMSDKEDLDIATGLSYHAENAVFNTKYTAAHFVIETITTVAAPLTPDPLDTATPLYSYAVSSYKYDLLHGFRGAFADEDARVAKIVAGYAGTIDPDVYNKRLFQVDLLFNSNQHTLINAAIASFVAAREDCFAVMALRVTDTKVYPVKLSALLSSYDYDSNRIALFTQHFDETNKYTGKRMKVSASYHIAKKLVANDIANGSHKAIAGKVYGVIGGQDMDISFVPNSPQEEELYVNKVNYFIKDRQSTRLHTQLTSQNKNSPLSDIPTIRTLLKTIRAVENFSELYQYSDLNDASEMTKLQSGINNILNEAVLAGAYSEASGLVYASDYDKIRKKGRVRITLTSPKFLEQILIDWIIN